MNFVSYSQLIQDTINFAHQLPRFDAVAGVPRSGMLPASIIAQQFHLPIYTFPYGWISNEYGTRYPINISDNPTILLIEDCVTTATHLLQAKNNLKYKNIITAAVYATSPSRNKLDYFYTILEHPRIFEWNLFQSHIGTKSLFDFDGIYCKDPPLDDDGPKYTKYISNVRPLRYLPQVLGIVTCRLNKYRDITTRWLNQNNMNYTHLHMMEYNTARERQQDGKYGQWKAEIYQQYKDVPVFVESNINQGKTIARITQRPVIVIDDVNQIKTIL